MTLLSHNLMETEHALKQKFKIVEYPFSAQPEIKIEIVKNA